MNENEREDLAKFWFDAMDLWYNGHLAEATQLLEEVVRRSRTPLHLAALGKAYVGGSRFDESRELFEEAISISCEHAAPRDRYICLFCKIYLAVRSDDPSFYDLMKEAASVPCDPALRRWLPLPLTPNVPSRTD